VGWFYLWSAFQPGNSWVISQAVPDGYYPLETAGFRSGHLYAAIDPHPALLALPDPYDPVANAPYRVHDMSLYKRHYYLYYGVTPVVILFWPVAALTGRFLTEPFAVALFCSAAIWVGMGLLLAIRRRHFPGAPFLVLVAAWVCLAWATPLNLLVEGPQFYQVPISCAIFLQALMMAAVYRALHSPTRQLLWMSVAGLLLGLSIGARPNYLASSVTLLIPVVFLAWSREKEKSERKKSLVRTLLWTFIPTAICGLGLACYNWSRFGSIAELGVSYQLAGARNSDANPFSLGSLPAHVRDYLFNPGHWDSYFPFFYAPASQPYGLVRYVPWSLFAIAAFLPSFRGERGERSKRVAVAATLACAFLANLCFLACFVVTAARYPGDFANAELILAGIGALALAHRLSGTGRGWLAGLSLSAVAAASLFFSMAVFAGWFPRKEVFLGVARLANWPAFAWQRAHGAAFGGLRMELRLPDHPPSLAEPLFETGRQEDQRDWLEIDYLPGNRARLSFFHAGAGAFPSKDFAIPADRKIVVEARCGSVMPPFGHPVFSGWSLDDFNNVKRDCRMTVNGNEVLRVSIDCYDSSPANLTLGSLAWFTGGMQQTFSGSILGVAHLPLVKPPKIAPLFTKALPVELSLYLPSVTQAGADPLIVTGSGKESDLLYCAYDGSGHVKFALDHYGAGGPISEWVPYNPLVPHTLTLWMGSMAGAGLRAHEGQAAPDRFVVLFDGRALLNVDQVFYPSTPDSAILGYNAYGSSDARGEFTGRIIGVRQVGESSLPSLVRSGSYGAIEMSVNFPYSLSGTQEPLVVTGVTGAGDFVYVRYVDPSHVMIGYDHWGVGGLVGNPIAVDYGQTHRIAISFASLYPQGSPLNDSKAVRVFVDGQPALVGKFASHPSPADRIKIGANPIGGSTCGPTFSGRILSVERFPEPRDH
jgi:hypothetical protein